MILLIITVNDIGYAIVIKDNNIRADYTITRISNNIINKKLNKKN